MTHPARNLTDDDVAAIVAALKDELVRDFYGEVGRGVWTWVKRALFVLLLFLAVQGMAGEKSFFHSLTTVKGT